MPTATLTWNAVTTNKDGSAITDLAGYEVFRGLGAASPTLLATLGIVTTYTDTSIPAVSQNVSYEVRAFDAPTGNRGDFSNIVTKVIDTNPPAAPTGLTVVIS